MASFEKIKDGVRAFLSWGTGKDRFRKTKTWPTMKQARAWAYEEEHLNGVYQKHGVIGEFTFTELFDEYATNSPQKKGEQWEVLRLNMFKRFSITNVILSESGLSDIEQFIKERLKTVNRELNLIRHCFTKAQHWRWLNKDHNPMEGLDSLKNPPPRDRLISKEEIDTMIMVFGYHEDKPITTVNEEVAVAFRYAIETAMRAGEITDICTSCCSLNKAVVTIEQTKNGYKREVPMTPLGVELLEKMYAKPEHDVCPYSLPVNERPERYRPKNGETPIVVKACSKLRQAR
jgi:integrase